MVHFLMLNIISFLSIIWGIAIIFLYWFFKEIRLFTYELIIWLCISRIILDINNFLSSMIIIIIKNSTLICLQTYIFLSFQTASWIITALIIYASYLSSIKKNFFQSEIRKRYRIGFFILTFLFSTISSMIIILIDIYYSTDKEEGPCLAMYSFIQMGFKSPRSALMFYLLNVFFIIVIMYLMIKISCLNNIDGNNVVMFTMVKWFPISRIIFAMPMVVNIALTIAMKNNVNDALMIIEALFEGLYSLGCLILYIMLPHVIISIKAFVRELSGGMSELEMLEPLEAKLSGGQESESNEQEEDEDQEQNEMFLREENGINYNADQESFIAFNQ